MTQTLPSPIEAYFSAKNRHDIDGMLASFGEDSVVVDEGETMRGRASIREWMETTTSKYRVTVSVVDSKKVGDKLTVSGLVSGNFPGSPATLQYVFVLAGSLISSLEIG